MDLFLAGHCPALFVPADAPGYVNGTHLTDTHLVNHRAQLAGPNATVADRFRGFSQVQQENP
ncbi:hypothetical protein LA6_002813 [Marinibacterium anthonyi]|nr:hypothetical protein LA6_002813 [Marinibacterium anthonyi]